MLIDINEEIYKSIFTTTELALILLRSYIKDNVNKSIVYETIKHISHNQKKIARRELENKVYPDFKKFFIGIHKENARKIFLKIKIVINNYAIENNLSDDELNEILQSMKTQLDDTANSEAESFIENNYNEKKRG